MSLLTDADRRLAESFAGARPMEVDEAARVQSDLAYARMKATGELQRRDDRRALEIQVQQEGLQG